METGSYQLTCFPFVPPPTNRLPFLPLPVRTSFHHFTHTHTPLFPFARSLHLGHAPSYLSPPPPPASPCGTSHSSHPPHPCFLQSHPLLPRWLNFRPLPLVFLLSPPFSPVSPPLSPFFPLFTVAQIKPTTLHKIPKKKRLNAAGEKTSLDSCER